VLTPGQPFDRYKVDSLLGKGAMGSVYKAYDDRLRRWVALKVLDESHVSHEARALLVREARLAATVNHPNLVMVFDVGESQGIPFMAMELIAGKTLREHMKEPPPLQRRIRWLLDIARGLQAAHQTGLVHRDVKPGNVVITDAGAKVLDFGIAKPTEEANARFTAQMPARQTKPGFAVGTPRYMAPEILRGEPCDARCDQFSWGIVAFELLTGERARGDSVMAGMNWTPPRMDSVSPKLAAVVLRALSPDPAARFATMGDVATALAPFAGSRDATMEFTAIAPPPSLNDLRSAASDATVGPSKGVAPQPTALAPSNKDAIAKPEPTRIDVQSPNTSGTIVRPAKSPPEPRRRHRQDPKFTPLNPAHAEALITIVDTDVCRELGGSARQVMVIVSIDVQGAKGRYFVTLAAVDHEGQLFSPASSVESLRAAADLISADAQAGNARWRRLTFYLRDGVLDEAAGFELV
jgi:serine/threonine protein kinase